MVIYAKNAIKIVKHHTIYNFIQHQNMEQENTLVPNVIRSLNGNQTYKVTKVIVSKMVSGFITEEESNWYMTWS